MDERPDQPAPDKVASRAELLPEERAAGSDDPEEQAEVILEDSQIRTEVPGAAPTTFVERRTSEQAAEEP